MTEFLSKLLAPAAKGQHFSPHYHRLVVPALLLALVVAEPTRAVVLPTLSDAFWQVAAYVAATLALFHYLSEKFDRNGAFLHTLMRHRNLQVLFASFMGALPGCGGAIVVITQFVRGNLSFGSVVAVLTATMGDAAFLLLATKPYDGVFMLVLGFFVGLISGRVVDALHGDDFLRPAAKYNEELTSCAKANGQPFINAQGRFWQWAVIPALSVALIGSFQLDADHLFGLPTGTTELVGAALAIVTVTFWALQREANTYESVVGEDPKCQHAHLFQGVAQDTNFVTVWVIAAFLAFELTIMVFHIDLAGIFGEWAPMLPLFGVLVGLLPGCGPQILVTSLYISGTVPMSAQIGNAISNDGDALFPAIALAPKAALVATVYSTIPALLFAYSYFLLVEI
ncbi:putative manganese transporter [Enterovibrio sp. ZSDZ35]|uniref:Manganese transporter n=1 Tax=Enterovibrio qingdaonensis TaxID=2899818 RepID=A0ABT5QK39_9GAMM|nr:putative manganese transporter [Enterovibrio sp. ZSDZ35]MDD1781358.1 putative manganese transporter [Enterovibrio sp. ZSDZ35]